MKERPILFSAPMVQAILEGRKTQTRRILKDTAEDCDDDGHPLVRGKNDKLHRATCPYGKPGDRLWVRESFAYDGEVGGKEFFLYAATDSRCQIDSYEPVKWTPSIHMPRRASRIDLEITGARVEHLQDISEEDSLAEGCFKSEHDNYFHSTLHPIKGTYQCWISARQAYEKLWERINGDGSWDANPWVWVVEFKRVRP